MCVCVFGSSAISKLIQHHHICVCEREWKCVEVCGRIWKEYLKIKKKIFLCLTKTLAH